MSEPNQPITPKWLSELQQRSWEPEILLSGIVLYGMFKVPDILEDFLVFFKLNVSGKNDINNLVALFKMGIYWLISGLNLHLICRGIWIGMVGLSYTFPKGINFDHLSFKGRFKKKVERTPSFEKIVIRLEKVCSSLFSISFMLFMSLIGGYIYFLVLIIIPFTILYVYFDLGFSGPLFDAFQYYVLVVLILGLLGLLDFVTLGYLRRFRWFEKLFWPIHKVISILTLSRFYRPIYYGVVTNFNKWVFFSFLLIFTFVSISGSGNITDTTYPGDNFSRLELWQDARGFHAFNGYYDDQNAEVFSMQAQIPSDVINSDVLKLFVVANIEVEQSALEMMPLDSLREVYPDTSRAALEMMVIDNYYEVSIDDEPIDVTEWLYYYKTQSNQRGYLTYISIKSLEEGMHRLKVKGREKGRTISLANIPFYRDVSFNRQEYKESEPK